MENTIPARENSPITGQRSPMNDRWILVRAFQTRWLHSADDMKNVIQELKPPDKFLHVWSSFR